MAFGHARIIDEPEEKALALVAMVDRFIPGACLYGGSLLSSSAIDFQEMGAMKTSTAEG